VETVEGVHERRHRGLGIHAQLAQPTGDLHVVTELGDRHAGQLRLVRDGRRHPRVGGETLERRQLAVREDSEKIDDRFVLDTGGHDG
jgi:hypothetical protein